VWWVRACLFVSVLCVCVRACVGMCVCVCACEQDLQEKMHIALDHVIIDREQASSDLADSAAQRYVFSITNLQREVSSLLAFLPFVLFLCLNHDVFSALLSPLSSLSLYRYVFNLCSPLSSPSILALSLSLSLSLSRYVFSITKLCSALPSVTLCPLSPSLCI
jgi:hypothetical protein